MDMYSMELNDILYLNTGPHIEVTRVPGGWIYRYFEEVECRQLTTAGGRNEP